MVQSLLDGIPATEHLRLCPRSAWPTYYRQLGEIARRVHDIRGPSFGPIAGPTCGRWNEAVAASLEDIATDLEGIDLDAVARPAALVISPHRGHRLSYSCT